MGKRVFDPDEPELMDRAGEFDSEWGTDLANLRGLNRHFGGQEIVRQFFGRIAPRSGERLTVLDLCTGSADLPAYLVRLAREADVVLEVDAVDFHPATMEGARQFLGDRYPEIRLVQADVLAAEEPALPYDIVLCSLALHHFTYEDAVELLRRMRKSAVRAALLADLERSWLCSAAVWAVTTFIYRDPMTVVDGRKSARAAFSKGELLGMVDEAGWNRAGRVRWGRFPVGRQAVFLEIGEGDG